MLYMVIERFKDRDAVAVYRRAGAEGRLLPEGLTYVGSWVETDYDRCFQLMECDDEQLFEPRVAAWQDLVDFEIVPVVTSDEAREAITPQP